MTSHYASLCITSQYTRGARFINCLNLSEDHCGLILMQCKNSSARCGSALPAKHDPLNRSNANDVWSL
jgi:hypothetical protein